MKNRSALFASRLPVMPCLLAWLALCGEASGGNYFTEPELNAVRPDPAKEMAVHPRECCQAPGVSAPRTSIVVQWNEESVDT